MPRTDSTRRAREANRSHSWAIARTSAIADGRDAAAVAVKDVLAKAKASVNGSKTAKKELPK
jgi:hypothetical protein